MGEFETWDLYKVVISKYYVVVASSCFKIIVYNLRTCEERIVELCELKTINFMAVSNDKILLNTVTAKNFILDISTLFKTGLYKLIPIITNLEICDCVVVNDQFLIVSRDYNIYLIHDTSIHCIGDFHQRTIKVFTTVLLIFLYDQISNKVTILDKDTFEIIKTICFSKSWEILGINNTSKEICLISKNQSQLKITNGTTINTHGKVGKIRFGPKDTLYFIKNDDLLKDGLKFEERIKDFDVCGDKVVFLRNDSFQILNIC